MTNIKQGAEWHVRRQISDYCVFVLDRVIADTAITNTVAETTLYTKTVDHSDITGKVLRLTLGGTFLNNTGVSTFPRLRLKFGSTTVVDSGSGPTFNEATNASTRAWRCIIYLTARTTATQEACLEYVCGNAGSVTTGVGGVIQTTGTQIIEGTAAETTSGEGTKALAVTWQHDAASTNLTITLKTAVLERL